MPQRRRSAERFRDRSPRRNFNRDQRPRDRNAQGHQGHRRVPKSSFMADAKGDEKYEWGRKETKEIKSEPVEKEKPNFGLSGKLTEDTNMVNGVVIKYSEPDDARKPNRRWRLYPFKGEQELPLLHIHRCSAFLLGRDRKVADIPLDHPSCSKQHAALQYRLVPYTKENGYQGKRVRPYLIDLDSANGTFLNGNKIEPRKYYELFERDVIKFGLSSRDYVLLHEHSKGDDLDDDVI